MDFLIFAAFAAAALFCIGFAIHRLFFPGRARLYWAFCLTLVLIGLGCVIYFVALPPAGGTMDRIPGGFSLGVWMFLIGASGVLIPAIGMFTRRAIARS